MKAHIPLKLTNKERKALEEEINKQTATNVMKLSRNIQALVLWVVHEHLRFGKKRLLRFQKAFMPMIQELQEFYMSEDASDTEFVCMYKLKHEVGVDVEELDEMFKLQMRIK